MLHKYSKPELNEMSQDSRMDSLSFASWKSYENIAGGKKIEKASEKLLATLHKRKDLEHKPTFTFFYDTARR